MSTPRSFLTSRPASHPCPRCGRLVLTGHAEGLTYTVDPMPVTPHAELAARQTGRSGYALIAGTLTSRTPSRIRGDTHNRPPVLLTHHCHQPPEPTGVDPTHAPVVTAYLQRVARRQAVDLTQPVSDDHLDTLALFDRELGARVLTPDEPPPF